MDIEFSIHALLQMKLRGIPRELVENVIYHPEETIKQDEKKIFQSVVEFPDKKKYLLRVFVNVVVKPNRVITVYYTTKIEKYRV